MSANLPRAWFISLIAKNMPLIVPRQRAQVIACLGHLRINHLVDYPAALGLLPLEAMNTILGALQVGLHVMVAVLLFFGLIRTGVSQGLSLPVLVLACSFGASYLAGTVLERRRARNNAPLPAEYKILWLGIVTAVWVALMWLSPDFMWLEFPLVFLFLALLPTVPAVLAVIALWAVAAFLPLSLYPDLWTMAAAIGPAIGTAFAVAIYYAYVALHEEANRYRRVAQQLRATREELIASERLAGRLEERERLSREIHDTVAQGLSSIVLMSRAIRRQDGDNPQLSMIEDVASANLEEARRFVKDLASPDSALPLSLALERVVTRAQSHEQALGSGLELTLVVEGEHARSIPGPIVNACIRAAQEGISNVSKHAKATHAVLSLSFFDNAITLDIADDGVGTAAAKGYGLSGLHQRIEDVGGSVDLESHEGEGTVLAIRIPLDPRKGA